MGQSHLLLFKVTYISPLQSVLYSLLLYCWKITIYLDKCEFANANTAFGISNGYFSIMLYPPPPTENVVYARGDFIPYIAISIPSEEYNVG